MKENELTPTTPIKEKKVWATPQIWLLDTVNSGAHNSTFHEGGKTMGNYYRQLDTSPNRSRTTVSKTVYTHSIGHS